jgi:D-threo-aldose 1-dehydrogenase
MMQTAMLEWFIARADIDCVLVGGRYSLLDHSAAEGLLPACAGRGVAVMVGGVFNSGVLADPAGADATYDYRPAPGHIVARATAIRSVCARYGLPLAAVALHFSLAHPAVTAAVVGARSAAEITEDAGYLSTPVPAELLRELASQGLIRADGAQ